MDHAAKATRDTKRKRSVDTRVATSTTLAFVSGEEATRGRLHRKVDSSRKPSIVVKECGKVKSMLDRGEQTKNTV